MFSSARHVTRHFLEGWSLASIRLGLPVAIALTSFSCVEKGSNSTDSNKARGGSATGSSSSSSGSAAGGEGLDGYLVPGAGMRMQAISDELRIQAPQGSFVMADGSVVIGDTGYDLHVAAVDGPDRTCATSDEPDAFVTGGIRTLGSGRLIVGDAPIIIALSAIPAVGEFIVISITLPVSETLKIKTTNTTQTTAVFLAIDGSEDNEAARAVTKARWGCERELRLHSRIAIGESHTCFINQNGQLKCWGYNYSGQLGADNTSGNFTTVTSPSTVPYMDLGVNRRALQVSAGRDYSCVVLDNGEAKCWGHEGSGQVGTSFNPSGTYGAATGETIAALPAINLEAPGSGITVEEIRAGEQHTCALLSNGGVKCFGTNFEGRIGSPHIAFSTGRYESEMGTNLQYIDLGTNRTALRLAVGYYHTCAILDNEKLKCWGRGPENGIDGQNGGHRGSYQAANMGDNLENLDFGEGNAVMSAAAGIDGTCALLSTGELKCVGSNTYCRLGAGESDLNLRLHGSMNGSLPSINTGTDRIVGMTTGWDASCVVTSAGAAKCWGKANLIGAGSDRGCAPSDMGDNLPTLNLGAGRVVKDIQIGYSHACALLDNEGLKCWGSNVYGQLGVGDTSARTPSDTLEYVDL